MNSQDLTTMKDIGKLIRDIRKQQGVTQEELAGISETGRRFISDVENGKNTTQTGKLLLVLKALGLNLYIFNETPPANAGGIISVQAKLAPYLRALGVQCNVVSLPR